MGQLHVAEQGECISSIAARFGIVDWQVVWNDAQNETLRKKRKDPNVLFRGDLVFVPTPPEQMWTLPTGKRHVIVIKKAPPETLRLRLLDGLDLPRADVTYELVVDGKRRQGKSTAEGEIVEKIPPQVTEAQLFLGEGEERRAYAVSLGALDPPETISGAQARLLNLGLDPGPVDGKDGPRTQAALREFQGLMALDVTGTLDDDTVQALQDQHGR